jgi:hypothetical protein
MTWDPSERYPLFASSNDTPVAIARRNEVTHMPLPSKPWWNKCDIPNNHFKPQGALKSRMKREGDHGCKFGLLDYFKKNEYDHIVEFVLALEKFELRKHCRLSRKKLDRIKALRYADTGILADFMQWFWSATVFEFQVPGNDYCFVSLSLFLILHSRIPKPPHVYFSGNNN